MQPMLHFSKDEIDYDEEVLCEEDIESFVEWLLIAVSKHAVGDNKPTLVKLRCNTQSLTTKCVRGLGSAKVETLVTAALFEILFPMKFAMHSVSKGLHTLMSSDVHLFHEFFEEPTDKAIKPVTLCILVTSEDHLNKIVVSP